MIVRSFEKDPKIAQKYEFICTDVLKFDFIKLAKQDMQSFIWASPVCAPLSHATFFKMKETKAMKKIGDLTKMDSTTYTEN